MSLKSKNVVFTGTLSNKREFNKAFAERAGATVHGSVSGLTHIVVAGPDAVNTAKVKAAEAKGVQIWTDAKFLAALKKAPAAPKRQADAAAAAAPVKRPAAAVAEPAAAPAAKRAKVSGGDKPLHGMVFYRSGSHNYQKAIGEFIVSLGGTWTKNPNSATFCLDGIEIMRSSYMFAAPYRKCIEAKIPIVCVPLAFTKGKPSDADKESLLKAMKGAEELLGKVRKEGMSSVTMAEMHRKEFKVRFPEYYNQDKKMYDDMPGSFKEAEKMKTGSYGVMVKNGDKLTFEIRQRGK